MQVGANFWDRLAEFGDNPALIDDGGGEVWTYRRLQNHVEAGRDKLHRSSKKLIFLFANNDAGAILCYLSALAAGQPIYIGKGRVDWAEAGPLLDSYSPDILLWKGPDQDIPQSYRPIGELFGYRLAECRDARGPIEGGRIGVLLSTSGSLGSPKMVRLARQSLSISAFQVAKALKVQPSHRAITALPLNFVYGLSVVHSHLAAGASLIVTQRSIQDRSFWRLSDEWKATSLAGVPWTFEMLRALSFHNTRPSRLRHLSLSGGALPSNLRSWLVELTQEGLDFHTMYGQTEAGGRISVLPSELFASKAGSVGFAVEQGAVHCDRNGGIVFQGPNVMLGYATERGELTDNDDLAGVLPTGDTGFLDGDGCLYVTGRTSRIAKLFGLRLNLDEIEAFLSTHAGIAVTCTDQTLNIYVERTRPPEFEVKLHDLVRRLRIPMHCAPVHVLSKLPRTPTGKIHYSEL
jgi:long-chain acyl-CoA synthetase